MHLMLCQCQLRSYGGRSHPKGPPVWSASLGMLSATRTSACGTWNWRTLTQTAGKSSQMTETAGIMLYMMVSGEERRRGASSWRTNGQNVKRGSKLWTLTSHPTLCATAVAETAVLGLDCWATPGTAVNRKTDPTLHTPLSPETRDWRMPTTTIIIIKHQKSLPYPRPISRLAISWNSLTGLRKVVVMPAVPRVNSLETIPFTAAHTYIAHVWEYPPPPPNGPPNSNKTTSYAGKYYKCQTPKSPLCSHQFQSQLP